MKLVKNNIMFKQIHLFELIKHSWKNTPSNRKINIIIAATNSFLVIGSFASVFLVYRMSSKQNMISQEALRHSDSVWAYQRTRDSIQGIKDSIYSVSQSKRDSLNKLSIMVNNRAFLVVGEININGASNGAVTNAFSFRVNVQNVGKTPAYEVRISKIKMSFGKMLNNDSEVGGIHMDMTKCIVIGAGLNGAIETVNDKHLNLENDNAPLYLYGRITYRDIFGKIHYSQFCNWGSGIVLGSNYEPTGNLNKAD